MGLPAEQGGIISKLHYTQGLRQIDARQVIQQGPAANPLCAAAALRLAAHSGVLGLVAKDFKEDGLIVEVSCASVLASKQLRMAGRWGRIRLNRRQRVAAHSKSTWRPAQDHRSTRKMTQQLVCAWPGASY